jgi:hypothetical protein
MTAPLVDARTATALAEHVTAIRQLGKQTVENVVEIGRRLIECKKLVGHGNWLPWLEREFRWSDRTALNFMRVAELSKSETVSNLNLPVKALYLLTAPSTPTEARDEIIDRAEAGETVPVAKVKRIIKDSKSRARSSSKTGKSRPQPQADEAAKAAAPKPQQDDFDAPLKPAHDVIARRLHKQFGEAPLAVQQHFIPYFLEYMRCDIDPPSAGEISAREIARKDAEIERLRGIQRHLEKKITGLESEITGLESELEELRGKLATGMSFPEFQKAIKEWEETVEAQKNIIRDLQNENANLRAGVGPPPADDGLGIPEFLRRAS